MDRIDMLSLNSGFHDPRIAVSNWPDFGVTMTGILRGYPDDHRHFNSITAMIFKPDASSLKLCFRKRQP